MDRTFLLYSKSSEANEYLLVTRCPYVALNGRWCDNILLNMHALNED
jgi:hypothetical protein